MEKFLVPLDRKICYIKITALRKLSHNAKQSPSKYQVTFSETDKQILEVMWRM